MEYSFPRYLLAKQSVDDRALNKDVLAALRAALSDASLRFSASRQPADPQSTFSLADRPLSVTEVGAGIGTMLVRLLRWNILPLNVAYTLVDEMPENIAFARQWLPQWARENGYQVETLPDGTIRLSDARQPAVRRSVVVHFAQSDVFEYIRFYASRSVDLLIAHAFLDLLPMPESLPQLFSLVKPGGLAWLTINFDGVTTLEPPFRFAASSVAESADESVDSLIERLYHQTMDTRPTGGDSRSGRHLFGHLKQVGAEILAAGASDWVVYPLKGRYPADEAYFLHFILHFFETSLSNHPQLDPRLLEEWLEQRRAQIERAELIYIAHQMDFLILTP
jgi:SAM-dependent methyltransferase